MPVPAGGSFEVSRSDLLQISGWAVSDGGDARLAGVYIQFGELIVPAAYGLRRSDVPAVYPGATDDSGFWATIAARAVAAAKVPIRLHFVLADRERVFTTGILAVVDVRELEARDRSPRQGERREEREGRRGLTGGEEIRTRFVSKRRRMSCSTPSCESRGGTALGREQRREDILNIGRTGGIFIRTMAQTPPLAG